MLVNFFLSSLLKDRAEFRSKKKESSLSGIVFLFNKLNSFIWYDGALIQATVIVTEAWIFSLV